MKRLSLSDFKEVDYIQEQLFVQLECEIGYRLDWKTQEIAPFETMEDLIEIEKGKL